MARLGLGGAAMWSAQAFLTAAESSFQFRYLVGSCMFGELSLEEILPQLKRTNSRYLDVWPRVHGNQREQIKNGIIKKY